MLNVCNIFKCTLIANLEVIKENLYFISCGIQETLRPIYKLKKLKFKSTPITHCNAGPSISNFLIIIAFFV